MLWLIVAFLACAPRAQAQPFAAARTYIAEGRGDFTFSGPRCCEGAIPGSLRLAYSVDGAGRVTIHQLEARVIDFRIQVRRTFGDDKVIPFFCNRLRLVEPAVGSVDARGNLAVPVGAVQMLGLTFVELGDDFLASCPSEAGGGRAQGAVASNPAVITGVLDPIGDRFSLDASFRLTDGGDSFVVHARVSGSYRNRPPEARIGFTGPGFPDFTIQGGCPPLAGVNPPTTEPNDPEGLRIRLRSASFDPDGTWNRSDIVREEWGRSRDGGPLDYLGARREVGPLLFELGRAHRILLSVTDRSGAVARTVCQFFVGDLTPPVVTPPAPLVLGCSEPGGARGRTSPPLAAFLDGGSARDSFDSTTSPLPPLVGFRTADDATFFAAGAGDIAVDFRFQDTAGNVGSARSTVRVEDRESPSLGLRLEPAELSPNGRLRWVRAVVDTGDDCGPVEVVLESITSNHTGGEPREVTRAEIGTDDRRFCLRASPTTDGQGQPTPRIYTVRYRATDAAGHETRASAEVRVAPGGGS